MKKLLFIGIIIGVTILSSCSKPKGELTGIYERTKPETNPYGMVYIPRGSFNLGPNDQSATWAIQPTQKNVSVDAFWIDQTEITNGEYRQFVYWVRDSIIRSELARKELQSHEDYGDGEIPAKGKYYTLTYDPFSISEEGEEIIPDTFLNWKSKIKRNIKWEYVADGDIIDGMPGEISDFDMYRAVNMVYFQGLDKTKGKQLNSHIMNYKYEWVNYDQAARPGNSFDARTAGYGRIYQRADGSMDTIGAQVTVDNASQSINRETRIEDRYGRINDNTDVNKRLKYRSDLMSTRIINIYPDTMCWMTEFAYSFNEPAMMNYFAHPTYRQFPVVGISWEQAEAFCYWRTGIYEGVKNLPRAEKYRLPTEAEWEYAARGGRHNATYPWGGPYVRDNKGCFMANFKPMRGNYVEDGYLIPSRCGSFDPNDYGLFDMAGNVAEWTSTSYDETLNSFTLDFNPSYEYRAKGNGYQGNNYDTKNSDSKVMRRKIIKGGSWKDVGAFLQCGFRSFEYQYISRPSIGFRCVRTYIGN